MYRFLLGSYLLMIIIFSSLQLSYSRNPNPSLAASAALLQTQEVCSGNKVPDGYVIIGDKRSSDCPSGYKITIKKAGDRESICFYSPIPTGHVVVGNNLRREGCQNNPGFNHNALDIKKPGEREIICFGRPAGSQPSLVPAGYVVVGKANSPSCIRFPEYDYNAQEIKKAQ
jgi:hypothetical protein